MKSGCNINMQKRYLAHSRERVDPPTCGSSVLIVGTHIRPSSGTTPGAAASLPWRSTLAPLRARFAPIRLLPVVRVGYHKPPVARRHYQQASAPTLYTVHSHVTRHNVLLDRLKTGTPRKSLQRVHLLVAGG